MVTARPCFRREDDARLSELFFPWDDPTLDVITSEVWLSFMDVKRLQGNLAGFFFFFFKKKSDCSLRASVVRTRGSGPVRECISVPKRSWEESPSLEAMYRKSRKKEVAQTSEISSEVGVSLPFGCSTSDCNHYASGASRGVPGPASRGGV